MQDRFEVPDVVVALRATLGELRVQVKPVVGDTVGARATVPVKPWRPATVIVEVPAVPASIVALVGLAVTV